MLQPSNNQKVDDVPQPVTSPAIPAVLGHPLTSHFETGSTFPTTGKVRKINLKMKTLGVLKTENKLL